MTALEPGASGILLVDKPAGITSHGVVSRVRKLAGTRKVGHAGTLDPMATGLLTIGVNGSTRLLTYLVGLDKEYLATIRLGQSTGTDDAEGDVTATAHPAVVAAVSPQAIAAAILPLTGRISQVPSSVSAIKVDGRRAYDRVREGETVELKAREVTVFAFDVLETRTVPIDGGAFLDIDVRVECSSGTYIRALARDLGATLGVGGHLTALRRSRVGPFRVSDATPLDDLDPAAHLHSAAAVAGKLFPVINLSAEQSLDLANGKKLAVDLPDAEPVAAISSDGRLVGLVRVAGGSTRVLANFLAASDLGNLGTPA
ncbi:MAG: tRNA pseudouridine(55) synthase TruB [Glaciihabitans sp.]|nr:tRNA pseudouridine(55) synthase TruB [Glaciihabitans sp.]